MRWTTMKPAMMVAVEAKNKIINLAPSFLNHAEIKAQRHEK